MYITRDGKEINVCYYLNENDVETEINIKVGSKREEVADKDTTIFDQIDKNKDNVISYQELDAYSTDKKAINDKLLAMEDYIYNAQNKHNKIEEVAFFAGLGVVFTVGAIAADILERELAQK